MSAIDLTSKFLTNNFGSNPDLEYYKCFVFLDTILQCSTVVLQPILYNFVTIGNCTTFNNTAHSYNPPGPS